MNRYFAILDIESTGGAYNEEGITEIAIHKFDGSQEIDYFQSLINPEREIQEFVVKLTGISNKMLKNAPKFYEVAKRIIEITKDCVIVAHNTSFDYRILKLEFDRLGYDFTKETLCTVELSQKLIPEADSHSLGKLVKALGIAVSNRHRASGDAQATLELFKILLQKDTTKEISKSLIKKNEHFHLSQKQIDLINNLSEKAGIFYLYGKDENLLYTGQSKNIKTTLSKKFASKSKKDMSLQKKTKHIIEQLITNELFRNIKFIHETNGRFNLNAVKKNTPENNKIRLLDKHKIFLIIEKENTSAQNYIYFIENGALSYFGVCKLNYQINKIEILKKNLIKIEQDLAIYGQLIEQKFKENPEKYDIQLLED